MYYGKASFYVRITDFPASIFRKSRAGTLPAILRHAICGMMKTSLPFVLLPACLALLGACSPTPSDRIAKNMAGL